MRLIARIRRRLARQDGFTMIAVMAGLLVVSSVSIAAIAAASGDINLARTDQNDKQASAAAEAGINDYLGNLNTDTNYWAKCVDGGVAPLNQKGVTNDLRKWRDVPGSTDSEYSIELIPAPGFSACDKANAVNSMVNEGNITIRSTGRVKGTDRIRTATATFRRAGFLDFLYYTDLENQDPAYIQRTTWALGSRATDTSGNPTGGQTLQEWAGDKCQRHWWGTQANTGEGRQEKPKWQGQYLKSDGTYTSRYAAWGVPYDQVDTDDICGEITFVTGDEVNGPFHSNDDIQVSGSPSFGTPGGSDRVEVSGAGYRPQSATPAFNPGPLRTGAAELDPPSTNQSLEAVADPGYVYTGQTTIEANGTTLTVTNPNVNGGAPTNKPWPESGVIYVGNGTCGQRYNPTSWNAQIAGCGDVRVKGTYSKDLTIAAQNDLIVTGNLTKTAGSDALLGLISDQFVRIWHPVDQSGSNYSNCTEVNSPTNVTVDAAILTLTGSFTVDNYWCGNPLGTLTVNGAIAQLHRGVVGTGNGNTGYLKNYNYNQDLKFRSPPHFLDPLQASWRILRQGEQSPPCVKTVNGTANGACPPGVS